jgi:hypothetical protein
MRTLQSAPSIRFHRRVIAFMGALLVSAGVLFGARSQGASPGFTMSVSPPSATLQAGSSERLTLTVTSENGFAGTVFSGFSGVSPEESDGPVFVLKRYDIPVSPTAPTATSILTASTSASTPPGIYTVTITGKDVTGGPQHGLTSSTTFTLTVE